MSDWDNKTLDPDNWDEFRTLGHRVLDDMTTHLQDIRSKPFNYPTNEAIKELMVQLSEKGDGAEKTYEIIQKYFLPHTLKIISPRFWGLVVGAGSPLAILTARARACFLYMELFILNHLIG